MGQVEAAVVDGDDDGGGGAAADDGKDGGGGDDPAAPHCHTTCSQGTQIGSEGPHQLLSDPA